MTKTFLKPLCQPNAWTHFSCGPFFLMHHKYSQLYKRGQWVKMFETTKYNAFDEWWGDFKGGGDFPSQVGHVMHKDKSTRMKFLEWMDGRLHDKKRCKEPWVRWAASDYGGWCQDHTPRALRWNRGKLTWANKRQLTYFHVIDW